MTPIEWTAFVAFSGELAWKLVAFCSGIYLGYAIGWNDGNNSPRNKQYVTHMYIIREG